MQRSVVFFTKANPQTLKPFLPGTLKYLASFLFMCNHVHAVSLWARSICTNVMKIQDLIFNVFGCCVKCHGTCMWGHDSERHGGQQQKTCSNWIEWIESTWPISFKSETQQLLFIAEWRFGWFYSKHVTKKEKGWTWHTWGEKWQGWCGACIEEVVCSSSWHKRQRLWTATSTTPRNQEPTVWILAQHTVHQQCRDASTTHWRDTTTWVWWLQHQPNVYSRPPRLYTH